MFLVQQKKIYECKELVINASKSGLFPLKLTTGKFKKIWLKTLTTKQMFQRLPIALAQVKAGKNSKNLLN